MGSGNPAMAIKFTSFFLHAIDIFVVVVVNVDDAGILNDHSKWQLVIYIHALKIDLLF